METRRSKRRRLIIIGAGIGGLAFALALRTGRRAVPDLRGGGGAEAPGRRAQPPAARDQGALRPRPGEAASPRRVSRPWSTASYTRHGQLIYREPRGQLAGYDWPQISIHRGDLHATLYDAARERLGPNTVTLGHKCVGARAGRWRCDGAVRRPDRGGAPAGARRGRRGLRRRAFGRARSSSIRPRRSRATRATTQYRGTDALEAVPRPARAWRISAPTRPASSSSTRSATTSTARAVSSSTG